MAAALRPSRRDAGSHHPMLLVWGPDPRHSTTTALHHLRSAPAAISGTSRAVCAHLCGRGDARGRHRVRHHRPLPRGNAFCLRLHAVPTTGAVAGMFGLPETTGQVLAERRTSPTRALPLSSRLPAHVLLTGPSLFESQSASSAHRHRDVLGTPVREGFRSVQGSSSCSPGYASGEAFGECFAGGCSARRRPRRERFSRLVYPVVDATSGHGHLRRGLRRDGALHAEGALRETEAFTGACSKVDRLHHVLIFD